jgi:tetratricopeptide (TPR) repeat protein
MLIFNGRFLWHNSSENLTLLSLSQALQLDNEDQYSPIEEIKLNRIATHSNSTAILRGRAFLLAADGKEDDFDKFWLESGLSEAELLHWGEIARNNQQFDAALAWYARALRANPEWGDPWYFTGVIYEETNQIEDALTTYGQAINAVTFTQIGLADAYTKMGRLYESSGNLQLATASYEKALSASDFSGIFSEVIALNGVSKDLIRTRDYELAIELLSKAVDTYPSYEWSYIRLGRAYLECCANYTQAIQNVEIAIRLNPYNKWAFLTAGDIYIANGQILLARQMYEKAVLIDPNWEAAQHALSKLNE